MNWEWMAWTVPTGLFFIAILGMLVGMTVWELRSPSVARRGWLPLETTRGDRLFIGLLGSACVHLIWLGLTDWSLWFSLGLSGVLLIVLMRFG